MEEKVGCEEIIYSEEYADYIVETGGNAQNVQTRFEPACVHVIDGSFLCIYKKIVNDGTVSYEKYGYSAVPKCYGLLNIDNVEATGALKVRSREGFELNGRGVLFGIVDTGIDYENPVFLRSNGESRVIYIWDQEDRSGTPPEGFDYGSEYNLEAINEAIASKEGAKSVPKDSSDYHGTFLAAVAVGNDMGDEFTGMAPEAEILSVKVKQAKQLYRDFYGIPKDVPCFQENDVMLGIRYLVEKAERIGKPIVILIGMGTNAGSHNGSSPIGNMINRLGNSSGICMVGAAGNETGLGHHYYGETKGRETKEIEFLVDGDQNLSFELWTNAIGALSIGITSPDGEYSGRLQIRTFEQRIDFVFLDTRVYVYYERVEYYSGEEVIAVRMKGAKNGIWKFSVSNLEDDATSFHIWMPMREFVAGSRFLEPNPDTIICNPANTNQIITSAAYNHVDESIYINSSRGFRENMGIKPDLAAPGVNVYGPVSPLRFGARTGTSVAAAHVAGAAVMLMQWGIVRENNMGMNTVIAKNYMVRGARRSGLTVPSKEYGWGKLDIYNTFESLKNY